MLKELSKYSAKTDKFTHVVVIKDENGKGVQHKFLFKDPEDFWDIIEGKDNFEMIVEKMPYLHPLIFKTVEKIEDETEIFDLVKDLQGTLLNLPRKKKFKKEDLGCVYIPLPEGNAILKFDAILMESKQQKEEIFPAVSEVADTKLTSDVFGKYWYVRPTCSPLYFPRYLEAEDEENDFESEVPLRELKIRFQEADEKDLVDKEIIASIASSLTEKVEIVKDMDYRDLLRLINKDKFKFKTNWEDLGAALFNITGGTDDGLKEWIEFTGYPKEECEQLWLEFTAKEDNFYTVKTLEFWAREDSPQKYRDYRQKIIKRNIDVCLKKTSSYTDYAKFIIPLIKIDFLCHINNKKKGITWIAFENHHFTESAADLKLGDYISEEIAPIFEALAEEIDKEIGVIRKKDKDAPQLKELRARRDKSEKLAIMLKNSTDKNKILNEIVEKQMIRDDKFPDKRNKNPFKRHYKNGIYNFKYGELVAGKPEDFITFSTGRTWRFNKLSYEKAWNYLNMVFTDPSIRDAFLLCWSVSMIFGNFHKLIVACIGDDGNNSKTTIFKVMGLIAGEYGIDLGHTFMTSPSAKMGGHCAELAELEDIPIAFHGETNVGEKLNSSLTKTISSGGDPIKVREPYGKKMKRYVAGTTVWIQSNFVLEFSDIREFVLMKRVVYIPFTSRFDDQAPDDPEEQRKKRHFKIIENFNNEIKLMLDGFTQILSETYAKYLENGKKLVLPHAVLATTMEYRDKVDIMIQYMNAHIRKEKDAEINLKEMYPHFRNWYDTCSYQPKTRPDMGAVREWLNKKLGNCGNVDGKPTDVWKGFRIEQ
jgi:hypothetical protein